MKVGIIGNGWVGKAMQDLFPEAITYVRDLKKVETPYGFVPAQYKGYTESKEEINQCDVVFICVPTPNSENEVATGLSAGRKYYTDTNGEGILDTSAVEECVEWCNASILVVRSTVNPGDCDRWIGKYRKSIVFQPEYLGETPNHPLLNTINTPFIILGGAKILTALVIQLYTSVYNANVKIRQVTLEEAEIIKLSENRAIAWKVAQCQELYDVCHEADVDYYTIRDAVYGDDPRFNLWWTFVFLDKRGFKSKCIPKDVYAWCAWAESLGYEPKITRAILEKNKEWINA